MPRLATIDKQIDITPVKRHRFKKKYPLEKMQPGDSIIMKGKYISNSLWTLGQYYGIKLSCRRQKSGVYRVWRVDGLKAKKR